MAKAAKLPFCTWIYDFVEHHLREQNEASKIKIPREMDELHKEVRFLREELRERSALLESREAELYKLKHGGFATVDSEKAKEYDAELVELLHRGRTVDGREILKFLKISPQDGEAMRLVYNQLEELKRFGLIKETANGWRWVK